MAHSTTAPERSNAYDLFILVLTVFSLIVMVLLLLPFSPATIQLLTVYDNMICVVFLIDFLLNLFQAPTKSEYFFGRRGWLDLLGSIPAFGFFRLSGLLRLARLSRLARITRCCAAIPRRRSWRTSFATAANMPPLSRCC